MATIDRTPSAEPPAEPAQQIPAPPVSDITSVHPTALAWAKLVLCALSVVIGVVIGLTGGPMELGIALVGAGLGGAGLRIIVNVRR